MPTHLLDFREGDHSHHLNLTPSQPPLAMLVEFMHMSYRSTTFAPMALFFSLPANDLLHVDSPSLILAVWVDWTGMDTRVCALVPLTDTPGPARPEMLRFNAMLDVILSTSQKYI